MQYLKKYNNKNLKTTSFKIILKKDKNEQKLRELRRPIGFRLRWEQEIETV